MAMQQSKLLELLQGIQGDAKLVDITSSSTNVYGTKETLNLVFEEPNSGRRKTLVIESSHEMDDEDRDKINTGLDIHVEYTEVKHFTL